MLVTVFIIHVNEVNCDKKGSNVRQKYCSYYMTTVMTHPYPMFVKIRYTTKIGKYCVAFVVN